MGQLIGIMGPQQEILALHPIVPTSSSGSHQNSYHFGASSPWQKNSSSICSNSRERKMKFLGVTSLRNAFRFGRCRKALDPRSVAHIFEVQEDALGGFGSKISAASSS